MKRLVQLLIAASLTAAAATAHAIPALQLYIDGATYDNTSESWLISSNSFDLWVLGDVSHSGSIFNVNLAASFYGTGSMSLTPTHTTTVFDPSNSPAIVDKGSDETQFAGTGFDQGVGTHAEYANADSHNFWGIGDFTLTDSQIGDYTGGLPVNFPDAGQINVYHVEISGFDAVHFDAFDHVVSGDHITYVKAPFSHDAGTSPPVPEPGTLALMGAGLGGLALRRFRRNG